MIPSLTCCTTISLEGYMKISIDKDKDNATGKSIRLKFNPSIQLLEDI